jgi:MoaA/NifB/PqqE/SkfB family radical SAM enzyme
MGFATNSSSTHSIIFSKEKVEDRIYDDFGFGWEPFILASEKMKKNYLASTIYMNTGDKDLVKRILGINLARRKKYSIYVDHQSCLDIPTNYDGTENEEFIKELCDVILTSGVIILGGNDNGDSVVLDYVDGDPVALPLREDYGRKNYFCRKDPLSGHWVTFDQRTGKKYRFRFQDVLGQSKIYKSSLPELVDMKITDYCPYNCEFCYQNSSVRGIHAPYERIVSYIDALGKNGMQTLEIAIGGGEPTLHPDFLKLLKYIREQGIVPNFTTRNKKILSDNNFIEVIKDCVGAFAFSINNYDEILEIKQILKDKKDFEFNEKITYQVIVGVISFEDLVKIREKLDYRETLTLLAFKKSGRGSKFKVSRNDYSEIADIFDREKLYSPDANSNSTRINFGIDTPLAKEMQEYLIRCEVPTYLYDLEEGIHSFYIDVVNNKMGRSSYDLKNDMVFISSPDKMLSIFRGWNWK